MGVCMSSDEKYDKKRLSTYVDTAKDDDESGSGGQGGKIDFVDFTDSKDHKRDDELSPQDLKRLLATHKDAHEIKVKHQKEKIEHNKNLKDGKITLAAHRASFGNSAAAPAGFKPNPKLADKVQFSGIDKQVTGLITENNADTNPEQRDALLNELKYQLGYQPTPKFNPKPQGPY